jgi:hypothetical protein
MQDIFISYKRDDEAFARRLHTVLAEWGYRPWLDVIDIKAGEAWDAAIHRALRDAETVIGVLTSESLSSINVLDEWGYALSNGKPLFLLWLRDIDEGDVPPRYIRIQRIDLRTNEPAGFERLRAALPPTDAPATPHEVAKPQSTQPPPATQPAAPPPAASSQPVQPTSTERGSGKVVFSKRIHAPIDGAAAQRLAQDFFDQADYTPTSLQNPLIYKRGSTANVFTSVDPRKACVVTARIDLAPQQDGTTIIDVRITGEIPTGQVWIESNFKMFEAELGDLERSLQQGRVELARSKERHQQAKSAAWKALAVVVVAPILFASFFIADDFMCMGAYILALGVSIWAVRRF